MNYGFVKVAAAIPHVQVANCQYNTQQIKNLLIEAEEKHVHIVVFPELCITGYSCGDLFTQEILLYHARKALEEITDYTSQMELTAIIGLPLRVNTMLLDVAAVIHKGRIIGLVPKTHNNQQRFSSLVNIETEAEFQTPTGNHSFTIPVSTNQLFQTSQVTFGIELGEDVESPLSPGTFHSLAGAEIIFNLSAHNEAVGKHDYLQSLLSYQSSQNHSGYVYVSCGYGESTTDLVFGGKGFIHENGLLLTEGERFSLSPQLIVSEIDVEYIRHERMIDKSFATSRQSALSHFSLYKTIPVKTETEKKILLTRPVEAHPFIPQGVNAIKRFEEIFNIQVAGLCKRIEHTHCQSVVVGISGGLDSTLALLVCIKAYDKLNRSRKEIIGITMPGFGTTGRTYRNALHLMETLGITIREINIREACMQHFSDIGHNPDLHNVTYENSQARERTQILMDVANQTNGLVIGTGDLSELALGWATYNGDHMSMYGVNAGIPKTLIQHLVGWIADNHVEKEASQTLHDILDTPISPELIPADENGNIKQKTEDLVGPYELHDFFLYHFVRLGERPSKIYYLAQLAFDQKYTNDTIKKWLTIFCRRFFNQQFKRSCLPDGPKVGSVSLSPRGDWQMPSDAVAQVWLNECEKLKRI